MPYKIIFTSTNNPPPKPKKKTKKKKRHTDEKGNKQKVMHKSLQGLHSSELLLQFTNVLEIITMNIEFEATEVGIWDKLYNSEILHGNAS